MQQVKERVALTSIAASGGLTIAKTVVGIATGSLAILSEAAHSLSDFVATVITYFAVRTSGKPADDKHQFGHGKVESVAALVQTALLFLLSGVVIWEAVRRLLGTDGHAVEATFWAFAVIVASIVVDFFRARVLYRTAAETSSEALEADALHFGSDMWSSLAVLVGLIGVWLGYGWMDAAAALVVAAFICVAGWRLTTRTISTLLDTAPHGVRDQIVTIVTPLSGVVAVDQVRVRQVGPTLFVDLMIAVSRSLPLDRLAQLKNAIDDEVRQEYPSAEVNIMTVPRALDDETVMERVLIIARNQALAIHHVTVQTIDERLCVSLDLEVAGDMSLAAAHDIADELETAIAAELGSDVEVETHIEPLHIEGLTGRDATAERVAEVHHALTDLAKRIGVLRDIHNVRVRETSEGEIVNFHCRVDPQLTVDAVHDRVDDVERAFRLRWPSVKRVIGHAEPQR